MQYKDNPEVNKAVNKIVDAFKNRKDLMISSVKVDVKLQTEFQETIIGTIPMSRQFNVEVNLNFVSCGDFNAYLAEKPENQNKLNNKLRDVIMDYFATSFHWLNIK